MTGPASVIEAIAAGEKAAVSIDCYLGGKLYPAKEPASRIAEMDDPVMQFHLREVEKRKRVEVPTMDVKERRTCFKEVRLGIPEKNAVGEARRCLNCRISSMSY